MKIMTLRAPDGLQNVLLKYANEQGISRNALILCILQEWAKRNEIEV